MGKNGVVFYASWQMECCGTPFSAGDTVKWLVCRTEAFDTPVAVGKVDYCYEAHSSEWERLLVLEGKVDRIKILYEKYAPSPDNPRFLVAVDGKMLDAAAAKGFDRASDGMEASGYLVSFCEYTVRQAEQSEVTFR